MPAKTHLITFSFNFKRWSSFLTACYLMHSTRPANKIYFIFLRIYIDLTCSVPVWNHACLWLRDCCSQSVFEENFNLVNVYENFEFLWNPHFIHKFHTLICEIIFTPLLLSFSDLQIVCIICGLYSDCNCMLAIVWHDQILQKKTALHFFPGQQVEHLLLAIGTLMVELAGFASLLLYTLNCWMLPNI